MEIKRIKCPVCGTSEEKSLKKEEDGRIICGHCGTHFSVPEDTFACPACGSNKFKVSTLGNGMFTCSLCGSVFQIVK